VDSSSSTVGTVLIYAGQEAADVASSFVREHSLTVEYYTAILDDACEAIDCERAEPALVRVPVDLGNGNVPVLEILEFRPNGYTLHQELDAFDQILEFCTDYGISDDGREVLVDRVVAGNVQVNVRDVDARLVWKQAVTMPNGETMGTVEIYEGEEPVDAIYDFVFGEAGEALDTENDRLRTQNVLLDHACKVLRCTRLRALLWQEEVLSDAGDLIGTVEVLQQDEPIDPINKFCFRHGLPEEFRASILAAACEEIECTRTVPVAFEQVVNDENGVVTGTVRVLEGMEVIDGVFRFLKDGTFTGDQIVLKNHFFQAACDVPGCLCTRNVAELFRNSIRGEKDAPLGELVITEYDEPVEKMWAFLEGKVEEGVVRENFFFNLKPLVCGAELVTCRREAPLIFQQSLQGPDKEHVGVMEVMLRQEPIDASYKFLAKNGLLAKDWDLQKLFKQMCDLDRLKGKCIRQQALKYHSAPEGMTAKGGTDGGPDINIGQVAVWEKEEVVDVLYMKKVQFNLTTMQMYELFYEICNEEDVYCERNVAVVRPRINPNKLDYAKNMTMLRAGEGTCERQYMGWRYISGWYMPRKEKFIQWLGTEEIESVYSGEMFAWQLFCGCFVAIRVAVGITLRVPYFRKWRSAVMKSRTAGKGWWGVHLLGAFLLCSFLWATGVEPRDYIDLAMHNHNGLIDDYSVEVLEGQEVADAVWAFAKKAQKKHHPLLRRPIYWTMIDELCEELPDQCTRKKAFERLNFGTLKIWGQEHKIEHWKNPLATMEEEIEAGIMGDLAKATCSRLIPAPPTCVDDMIKHNIEQYEILDGKTRNNKKNMYYKIGVNSAADAGEIHAAASRALNKLGGNFSPYARVDNGTRPHHGWDHEVAYAYGITDGLGELFNETDREWYDKPCEPVFGGAMCSKTDAKGNMNIEMGASEDDD